MTAELILKIRFTGSEAEEFAYIAKAWEEDGIQSVADALLDEFRERIASEQVHVVFLHKTDVSERVQIMSGQIVGVEVAPLQEAGR